MMRRIILIFSLVNLVKLENIGDECEIGEVKGICKKDIDCGSYDYKPENIEDLLNFKCGFYPKGLVMCCPDQAERNLQDFVAHYRNGFEDNLRFYCSHPKPENTITNLLGDRIMGGHDVAGNLPYFAALAYYNEEKFQFLCGGSLISIKFVLTAAHCIQRDLQFVRLGQNTTQDRPFNRQVDYNISKKFIHPDYRAGDPRDKYHDIALLELEDFVQLDSEIWPVCLYSARIIPKKPLMIAGFGSTGTENGEKPEYLKYAYVTEVEKEKCAKSFVDKAGNSLFNQIGLSKGINEFLICAFNETTRADTCDGDSGTALTLFDEFKVGIYKAVGITAFGVSCGSTKPGFYTRISPYIKWIESKVWKNPENLSK